MFFKVVLKLFFNLANRYITLDIKVKRIDTLWLFDKIVDKNIDALSRQLC